MNCPYQCRNRFCLLGQDSFSTSVSNLPLILPIWPIGVSQVTPLLWNPHSCFQQVIFSGSHFMPHALLFLHHAVVLHPITNRNAFRTGTPSYTAQAIIFQTSSAHNSAKDGRPNFFHLVRSIRAVRALYATHSSPGCILGLKVKLRIFVSQRCTIRAL